MAGSSSLAALARKAWAAVELLAEGTPFEATGIEFAEKSEQAIVKPFDGFENFDACVAAQKNSGHSDESAHKICGALQAQAEKGATVEKCIRIFKSTTEERYVLGIVLEPTLEMGEPDSQGDVYSAEDVRQAAYNFMQNYQTIGIQHTKAAGDKIKILESWIQRDDATIDGQIVKAGTWLLGVRIVDDDLWQAVKDGSFTGFSIGGMASRTPVGA